MRWIVEIVKKVSRDRLLAVIQLSRGGDFASSGKFHLECSGAGVQHADSVGIFGPVVSEDHFQVSWELFECHTVWLKNAAGLRLDRAYSVELRVEDTSCNETHHHVGSIQTVHTVYSEHSLLQLNFRDSWYLRFVVLGEQLLYSLVDFEVAVAETEDGVSDISDQLGEVVPACLGLSVEVEPSVLHLGVVVLSHDLGELLSNALLAALLVDQIHQVNLVVVLLERLDVVVVSGLVLQVVLLDEE